MSAIDWITLFVTLFLIAAYGIYKTRNQKNLNAYLLDGNSAKWWTIGLSVMATQASAITFLSTPGQAFDDGMRFVQFYFGLPLAMIVICVAFIPRYAKLKVFTAYEYLESRFDLNTRLFTAFLFLLQRGMAAGITIYAPAIVLSTVLGVSLNSMIILIGGLVVVYTVSGGTAAVNITQKYQMLVIFLGLFIAFFVILESFPETIGLKESLKIASASGKLNILDFSFNLNDRYTFWSGIIGGGFLALSYFGTDQSQVQRYLTGKSVAESRYGLLFNGLLKVPMQFFILFVGVLVFVFYQFHSSPIFFNSQVKEEVYATSYADQLRSLEAELQIIEQNKQNTYTALLTDEENPQNLSDLKSHLAEEKKLRTEAKNVIALALPQAETNDKDYVFIHFILNHLPIGLIGLLLAVFFCAAMSSTASELNALASTSLVDFYKRLYKKEQSEKDYVFTARALTVIWGIIAVIFAGLASLYENLIQFVNIIGSLFYGTILGIFLMAFYSKKIRSKSVLYSAILTELIIIALYKYDLVAFLWLTIIGVILVALFSIIFDFFIKKGELA